MLRFLSGELEVGSWKWGAGSWKQEVLFLLVLTNYLCIFVGVSILL